MFDDLQVQMSQLVDSEDGPLITKRQLKNWFSNRRAKGQKGKDEEATNVKDEIKEEPSSHNDPQQDHMNPTLEEHVDSENENDDSKKRKKIAPVITHEMNSGPLAKKKKMG